MAEYQQENLKKNKQTQEGNLQQTAADVQRESYGPEGGMLSDAISTRIQNQRGSGASLPPSDNKKFTARFGRDMSDVRIHSGAESESLNETLNSRAFTVGSDIFLGKGVKPGSSKRDSETLTHELTHVAQTDGKAGSGALRLGANDTAAEHEARSAARGSRTSVSAGTVQREDNSFLAGLKSIGKQALVKIAGKAGADAIVSALGTKVKAAVNKLSPDDRKQLDDINKKIEDKNNEITTEKENKEKLEKETKQVSKAARHADIANIPNPAAPQDANAERTAVTTANTNKTTKENELRTEQERDNPNQNTIKQKEKELRTKKAALETAAVNYAKKLDTIENDAQKAEETKKKQAAYHRGGGEALAARQARIREYNKKAGSEQDDKIFVAQQELDDLKGERLVLVRKGDSSLTYDEVNKHFDTHSALTIVGGLFGITRGSEADRSNDEIEKNRKSHEEEIKKIKEKNEREPQTDWGKKTKGMSDKEKSAQALIEAGVETENVFKLGGDEASLRANLSKIDASLDKKAQKKEKVLDIRNASLEDLEAMREELQQKLKKAQMKIEIPNGPMDREKIQAWQAKIHSLTENRNKKGIEGVEDISEASAVELANLVEGIIAKVDTATKTDGNAHPDLTDEEKRTLKEDLRKEQQKLLKEHMEKEGDNKELTQKYEEITDQMIKEKKEELERLRANPGPEEERINTLTADIAKLEAEKKRLLAPRKIRAEVSSDVSNPVFTGESKPHIEQVVEKIAQIKQAGNQYNHEGHILSSNDDRNAINQLNILGIHSDEGNINVYLEQINNLTENQIRTLMQGKTREEANLLMQNLDRLFEKTKQNPKVDAILKKKQENHTDLEDTLEVGAEVFNQHKDALELFGINNGNHTKQAIWNTISQRENLEQDLAKLPEPKLIQVIALLEFLTVPQVLQNAGPVEPVVNEV